MWFTCVVVLVQLRHVGEVIKSELIRCSRRQARFVVVAKFDSKVVESLLEVDSLLGADTAVRLEQMQDLDEGVTLNKLERTTIKN